MKKENKIRLGLDSVFLKKGGDQKRKGREEKAEEGRRIRKRNGKTEREMDLN